MPIIGPGTLDIRPGNPDPMTLGHHVTCAPWRSGKQSNTNIADSLDLAVFRIEGEAALSSRRCWRYDTPVNVATTASLAGARNVKVWKVGRTTGMTTGQLFGQIGHSTQSRLRRSISRASSISLTCWSLRTATTFPSRRRGIQVHWWCGKGRPRRGCRHPACASPGDEKAFLMPMEAVLGHFGATLVGGRNVQAGGIRGGPASHGAARP